MKTCGWCGNKGCVDEHPRCPGWARAGSCASSPFFMSHTCRESCGVCGFLAPGNKEDQVVDGLSYTDPTKDNFDCGRYKPLCEINGTPCDEEPEGNSASEESFCGATMIADRWALTASHCFDDFRNGVSDGPKKVRVIQIRQETKHVEDVEVRHVYKHPNYRFPNLYNDIALVELGRRVEYNYEKFGDTPACLDQGLEDILRTATLQGEGKTETRNKGTLLETNLTVISNQQCKDILEYNVTHNENNRRKILLALPLGLDYGTLCAQGFYHPEERIFSGACKGDGGGPLTQEDKNGRTTLIGILSGGIDCGKGYPDWYTRVEYYTPWIHCIIEKSIEFNTNFKTVDRACAELEKTAKKQPECEKLVKDPNATLLDLDIGFEPALICLPYKTGTFARANDEPKVDKIITNYGNCDDYSYDYNYPSVGGGDDNSGDEIFCGGDPTGVDEYDDYNDYDYADKDIFGDR